MLYDYYGFPPESYELTWPAPGEPELAARVAELLGGAGFASAENATRGFDHGTFVPLKLTYPDADVPTVQLSLKRGLDPAEHLAHRPRARAAARRGRVHRRQRHELPQHARLRRSARRRATSRRRSTRWLARPRRCRPRERDDACSRSGPSAPSARAAHPREEHLLPLMVVAGAAGDDRGSLTWSGTFSKVHISAFHYG